MDEVGFDALNLIVEQNNVPYVEDLPKDLGPGSCIRLTGLVKPECYRFVLLFYLILG